jgi:hypothetical protein
VSHGEAETFCVRWSRWLDRAGGLEVLGWRDSV